MPRYDRPVRENMIEWLYGLQHFGVKLGLENISGLLQVLGRPERGFRSVHVAGTNGKGSVGAMIDALLGASGVGAGLFTSPHLVRPHERIRIAGRDIGDEELQVRLARMRERIGNAIDEGALATHPSFFEVITATALECFAEHDLEAAVLEVGLGGRLDATNAVEADVGVVVSIGKDHTKTLGETVERIAGEKAGIIKQGMRVVSGVVQQAAADVLQEVCRQRRAELIDARWAARLVAEEAGCFTLTTRRNHYPGLRLSLPGRHQVDNARIAVTAYELLMERLGQDPDAGAVRRGLEAVRWPGRLHWIEACSSRPRLLLDGAHNPAGMRCLVDHLRRERLEPEVLVFGATSGKPVDELLEALSPLTSTVVLTRPPVERGIDPAQLEDRARARFARVEACADPGRALERAGVLADGRGFVLITGSLYLVGEMLGLLTPEPVPGPVAF